MEVFKLHFVQYLDAKLFAQDVKGQHTVDVMNLGEDIVIRIVQEVYGKRLGILEIETPTTWWQMFKKQYMPRWFLARWPVINTVKVYEARVLYPAVTFPLLPHNVIFKEFFE